MNTTDLIHAYADESLLCPCLQQEYEEKQPTACIAFQPKIAERKAGTIVPRRLV
jgi:hypothetical protein